VPSLSFLSLSLLSVKNHRSYPVMMEPIIQEKSSDDLPKSVDKTPKKGKKGRPTGSCNKNRKEVELSNHLGASDFERPFRSYWQ